MCVFVVRCVCGGKGGAPCRQCPRTSPLIQGHLPFTFSTVSASKTVVERCLFEENHGRPSWTKLRREAWISTAVYGLGRPIQEFGLARFKSNQAKAMRGLEYSLSKLQTSDQGESSEKQKPLPPQATPTPNQKPKQFV
ncbi:PRELI domain-containing protein 1, mitochondrial-like [Haplochromis burtoni]|uniref:PRELI domain-containing protein 1, mitochondrial-like n=1 Tax=Haplochromis burtoni TaxID=8153 RepID=UPI001C2D4F32|nr:PRELI domain-containing protein 1, mitochondrial-like [Haplochromis burtoni]